MNDGGFTLRSERDLEALQRLAKDSEDVDALMWADPQPWRAFNLWLTDPGANDPYGRARYECQDHLKGWVGTCDVKFSLVLRRIDAEQSRVVHAEMHAAEGAADQCRGYGMCVLEGGWIGRTAPMFGGDGELFAAAAGELITATGMSQAEKIAILEREAANVRRDIANVQPEDLAGDPLREFNFEYSQRLLAHLEFFLQQLRGG
jgi:hypothetical protein